MATQRQPLHLCNLPNILRTYNIVPLDDPPVNSHCYVCWRDYNTIESLGELPCRALQIQPCRHIIGSECFKDLCCSGMNECQLCRQPIKVVYDPVPKFVRWLAGCTPYQTQIEWAEKQINLSKRETRKFNTNMWHLFHGEPTREQGFHLWLMYAKPVWTATVLFEFQIIGIQIVFWALELLTGMQYPELFLIKELLGPWAPYDSCAVAVILDLIVSFRLFMDIRGFWQNGLELGMLTKFWACKLFFARAATLMFTLQGCLGGLIVNAIITGFIVGCLLACGRRLYEARPGY